MAQLAGQDKDAKEIEARQAGPKKRAKRSKVFSEEERRKIQRRTIIESFLKLDPWHQVKNFVMFVVEVGSAVTTLLFLLALWGNTKESALFIGLVSFWLWFTVIFVNYSEALAEGRGKAQAVSLRKMRTTTPAKQLRADYEVVRDIRHSIQDFKASISTELRKGNLNFVEADGIVPVDGEILEGVASVDESAITGESAPVIRESGGDRSSVTGGTRILSDWLMVRAVNDPGEGFIDKMINLIEAAKRQKPPNEIALSTLLIGLTIIFIVVCATLIPFSVYSVQVASGQGTPVSFTMAIALQVCLAPTTIGGLLSAIGIAGMDRLIRKNVIATSSILPLYEEGKCMRTRCPDLS